MEVPITPRQALFYDYVSEDLIERRAPHRPAHIGLVREWMADGRLLMGGALGDPPHGALLVFASGAERFARARPLRLLGHRHRMAGRAVERGVLTD